MFHFEKNFGVFVGKITANEFHKHYAMQISVSSKAEMKLTIQGEQEKTGKAFYISSKTNHKLLSAENQLTILINPLSSLGHHLYLNFGNTQQDSLPNDITNRLTDCLLLFEKDGIDFNEFCQLITEILNQYKCSCEKEHHSNDERIIKALEFMDANFDRVCSLEEIAERCYLSPSRFLHLFKEKTKLNFRRYQLWNKLVMSLPYLLTNSITHTAYTFGFTDSSHYTRTFKETFGVNPSFLFQKE
jgi:AraC-like DNA-binding protein